MQARRATARPSRYASLTWTSDFASVERARNPSRIRSAHRARVPRAVECLGDVPPREEQALAEAQRLHAAAPQLAASCGLLAVALALSGRRAEAAAIVDGLERSVSADTSVAVVMAIVHAMLGDRDRAFGWLDAAASAHDIHLVCVSTHPLLDTLHDDPRWPAWLARHFNRGNRKAISANNHSLG